MRKLDCPERGGLGFPGIVFRRKQLQNTILRKAGAIFCPILKMKFIFIDIFII